MTRGLATLRARTLAKVAVPEDPDGCWLWTAARDPNGYGRVWDGTARASGGKRVALAHRVVYALFEGPIPDGMQLDHVCHEHACVRPGHLRTVTDGQNKQNRSGATARSQSGVRGVHRPPGRSRWHVNVRLRGRTHYGGTYADLSDAERAAIDLRNRLFTHNEADRRESNS